MFFSADLPRVHPIKRVRNPVEQATIGGDKLRSLRRERHDERGKRLTIESLASAAGVDYRTISDIERGVAKRPPLEMLQRIFTTLAQFGAVSVEDKNLVLSAYGYHVLFVPPTEAEVEHACHLWLAEYTHIHLPSYLVSYNQRLLIWNRYAPAMLGIAGTDPQTARFKQLRIFDMVFNPELPTALKLLNPEELAPKLLALIKAELRLFRSEAWYQELIQTTSADYPEFAVLWNSLPDDLEVGRMRTVGPIRIQYGEDMILTFNIYSSDFVSDPRFRVVQYHPADSSTIKIWNQWVEAAESAADPDA
ncbi:MAG: helix-turn-helix transcriptional regulator [Chloroflexaceae bacterium]|nr:helix-turn-helix transcriptional regulator [Chloroflexaceae bacterium]